MNDYLKARELFNEWWFVIIGDVYQIFIRGDVTLTESNMRNSFPLHQHSDEHYLYLYISEFVANNLSPVRQGAL